MGKLLDEDTVIKVLEHWKEAFKENSHHVSASDLSLVIKDVRELSPAQPEIVRCKDCIYYNSDCVDAPYGLTHAIYWCDLHYDAVYDNLAVNPDDFCSRAERRTDG